MPGLLDYAKMVQQLNSGGLLGNVASPMGPLKEGLPDNPMTGLEGAKPYGGGSSRAIPKDIELRTAPYEYGGMKISAVNKKTGEEVGYIRYRPTPKGDFNWIDGMAVRSDLQRQGINSAMMDKIKGHKAFAHTTPEGEAFLKSYSLTRPKDDLSWGPGS
jgi:hypothetical protein